MTNSKSRRSSKRQRRKYRESLITWGWTVLAIIVIFALIGLASNNSATAYIEPASGETLAQGKAVYDKTCAVCHGENGEGDIGLPLNGTAHTWHHVDRDLRTTIREGIPGTQMQGHEDHLSPEEIDAVIAFVKVWWTPEQREMQRTGRHPM